MAVEHYRAREAATSSAAINTSIAQLLKILKSDVAAAPFREYSIATQFPPDDQLSELCVSVHRRSLITASEHVWGNFGTTRSLFGRIGVFDLVDGKPHGEPYVSLIVRMDGFISFDGTIDVTAPVFQTMYEEQIATDFAKELLLSVQNRLASIAGTN
jgi:hypothetical protein